MAYSSAREVFENYVPKRLAGDRELAAGIRAVYEFRIIGEGVWTLDFTGEVGTVEERECPDAGCFIVLEGAQVGEVMEDPMTGLKLLMTGQLKIGGAYSLAEHLIKVFRRDPKTAAGK
jgi:hypothetical protein